MINFGGSKEGDYWSFPLPPISPAVADRKSSASCEDVRAQVKVLTGGVAHRSPPLHPSLACVGPERAGLHHSHCSGTFVLSRTFAAAEPRGDVQASEAPFDVCKRGRGAVPS